MMKGALAQEQSEKWFAFLIKMQMKNSQNI